MNYVIMLLGLVIGIDLPVIALHLMASPSHDVAQLIRDLGGGGSILAFPGLLLLVFGAVRESYHFRQAIQITEGHAVAIIVLVLAPLEVMISSIADLRTNHFLHPILARAGVVVAIAALGLYAKSSWALWVQYRSESRQIKLS